MHLESLTFFPSFYLVFVSHFNLFFSNVDMASFYETIAAESVLALDQSVIGTMRAKIEEEIKKLDEK